MFISSRINGVPKRFMKPSRALRQRDPLSLYLFLMCIEELIESLKKAESNNGDQGIKICRKAPPINHLLFVDDRVIFCKANVESN